MGDGINSRRQPKWLRIICTASNTGKSSSSIIFDQQYYCLLYFRLLPVSCTSTHVITTPTFMWHRLVATTNTLQFQQKQQQHHAILYWYCKIHPWVVAEFWKRKRKRKACINLETYPNPSSMRSGVRSTRWREKMNTNSEIWVDGSMIRRKRKWKKYE